MPVIQEAQMHESRVITGENSTFRSLIIPLCFRGSGGQSSKRLFVASGYELGVSESLVVAAVAKKLRRVFEEELQFVVADAGFLLQGGPVPVAGLVEGEYEIEDVLGLGGDLTEGDACASEGGSRGALLADVRSVKAEDILGIPNINLPSEMGGSYLLM